jgi:hypothetical protein
MSVGGDNLSPKTPGVLEERRMSKLLFRLTRRIKDGRTLVLNLYAAARAILLEEG